MKDIFYQHFFHFQQMKTFILLLLCIGLSSIYAQQPKKAVAKPVKKTNTTISLSENTFDFGYVNENGYVSKELTIRNIGTTDLYLGEIAALCVVADYTFAPIPPGKSSVIKVSFSTEGKVGEQYRAVPIKGNIENKEDAIIYIKGVVYPK